MGSPCSPFPLSPSDNLSLQLLRTFIISNTKAGGWRVENCFFLHSVISCDRRLTVIRRFAPDSRAQLNKRKTVFLYSAIKKKNTFKWSEKVWVENLADFNENNHRVWRMKNLWKAVENLVEKINLDLSEKAIEKVSVWRHLIQLCSTGKHSLNHLHSRVESNCLQKVFSKCLNLWLSSVTAFSCAIFDWICLRKVQWRCTSSLIRVKT